MVYVCYDLYKWDIPVIPVEYITEMTFKLIFTLIMK